jgi:hypothetical protein
MSMPKYKNMRKEEILAVLQTSHSLGIDPFLALNKDLYPVNGKIEMSAELMNRMIRKAGHSVRIKQLDNFVCVLTGKRCDTNDIMEASFSIEDAKQAGIYKNAWTKFPQDMLWARALSRLGRRLFPDVLCGCYVQGEISDAPPLNQPVTPQTQEKTEDTIECRVEPVVSPEKVRKLSEIMEPYNDLFDTVMKNLENHYKVESLFDLTPKMYDKVEQYVKTEVELRKRIK